jgi:hypothetical protein
MEGVYANKVFEEPYRVIVRIRWVDWSKEM